jgi:hypothetical protein
MTTSDRTRRAAAAMPAGKVLEMFFLEARSKILDVAAMLDRLNRGPEAGGVEDDPRVQKIRQAIEVLADLSGGRAERIQKIFSLDYDPQWERPTPK